MVELFVDVRDGIATQSKAQLNLKFLENKTSVRTKLNQIFSILNQRRCRKEPVFGFEDTCIAEDEEQDKSTQFLQTQNRQLAELQDHLER